VCFSDERVVGVEVLMRLIGDGGELMLVWSIFVMLVGVIFVMLIWSIFMMLVVVIFVMLIGVVFVVWVEFVIVMGWMCGMMDWEEVVFFDLDVVWYYIVSDCEEGVVVWVYWFGMGFDVGCGGELFDGVLLVW